jgi:hypothetical protein
VSLPAVRGDDDVALLHDVPTTLEDDAFAHKAYVDVLERTLRAGTEPLTIGLLGPWGVGKSTVLKALRKRMASEQCGFVIFDAWRYDADTMRRQLLRDVAAGLGRQKALRWRFRAKHRLAELDFDQQTTSVRVRPSAGGFVTAAVQAVVAGVAIWIALQIDVVADALHAQTAKGGRILPLVLGLVTLAATVAGQLLRPLPVVRTLRRTEDPDRFHRLFRELVSYTKPPRLVIAVDNLDRCPPDVALELLATIKTYLEPASKQAEGTDVLFVLAIDDDALLHQLNRVAGMDGEAFTPHEYLRKIFTATVRMAPLHRQDLRAFAIQCFGEMRPPLGLTGDEERQLATFMDAALRSTPRQVIQFLNNLLLRIEVVRGRERATADVPLSDHLLVIAKLALIEESWPGRYRALQQSPQLLEVWDRQAREIDPHSLEPDFAAFLRISLTVRVADIRPFLELRQDGLDDFDTFRLAVTTADRAEASRILGAVGEDLPTYLDRLKDVYDEEIRARFFAAARSVVDVALADARLGPEHPTTVELVGRMIDDPQMRDELAVLPAEPLIRAAMDAGGARGTVALASVVARLGHSDAEIVVDAAEALATHRASVMPEIAAQIELRTSNDPLLRNHRALLLLGTAAPAWLSVTAADQLALRLEQDHGMLAGDAGDDAAELLGFLVDTARFGQVRERIARGLVGVATQADPDEVLERVRSIALQLIGVGVGTPDLVQALARRIGELPSALAEEVAALTWPLVLANRLVADHGAAWIGALAFSGHWRVIAGSTPDMTRDERAAVTAELVGKLIQSADRTDLPELFTRMSGMAIDGGRFESLEVARNWVGQGQPLERVLFALNRAGILIDEPESLESLAVDVVEDLDDIDVALPWLELAVRPQPVAEPIAEQVVKHIARLGLGPRSAKSTITALLGVAANVRSRTQAITQLVAREVLAGTPTLDEQRAAKLYDGLLGAHSLIAKDDRQRLRSSALGFWLRANDRDPWERIIVELGRWPGDETELPDIVPEIFEAERACRATDYNMRVALLRLVAVLSTSYLDERLGELRRSGDLHDQRVAARF